MMYYLIRRLLLVPVTLFCIVLINFVIINLAPGEPSLISEISSQGEASRRVGQNAIFGQDERYLQFREFYGLTLPVLYNNWNFIPRSVVLDDLKSLVAHKDMTAKEYNTLQTAMGDKAHFVLRHLISIMQDVSLSFSVRRLAFRYFLRGAHGFVYEGHNLSSEEKKENETIAANNLFLDDLAVASIDTKEELNVAVLTAVKWFSLHKQELNLADTMTQKVEQFFFKTRFARYLFRVLRLDFGVTRRDPNRSVISEVVRRLKYSLTLSILPMIATLFICLFLGMVMAVFKDSLFDHATNFILLLLYATPVFVVAPFLIEKVALDHNYPGTDIAFPIRGFSSPDAIYNEMTTWQRFLDVLRHITLPLLTIFYGSLAMQTRLSRAVFIDILSADYVRTARAKGVSTMSLYFSHVGRNAAIPMITSVAGSLGLVLGGSIIVETIFEIHGFGKFFYDAILDRDYNVMMFSVLVGSFLALIGYLIADLTYMWLDPRVNLENTR